MFIKAPQVLEPLYFPPPRVPGPAQPATQPQQAATANPEPKPARKEAATEPPQSKPAPPEVDEALKALFGPEIRAMARKAAKPLLGRGMLRL